MAETSKINTEAINSRMTAYRSLWDNVTTPDQAAERIIGSYADPVLGPFLRANGMTPEKSLTMLNQASQSPQSFQQFVRTAQIGTDKMINHMIDIEQRQRGTVPAGYRMTQEGNLEAIPGGPTTTPLAPKEVQKLNAAYPKAESSVKAFETTSDDLIKKLEALKNHKGLEGILGTVYGRTGSLTADSQAAQQLYDTILAKGAFNELTAMRQASPTGGALGNVSNQEGQYLRQAFGALGRVQSKEDFQKAVDDVITQIQSSKARTRETFDETYSYRNNPTGTSTGGGAPITGDSPAAKALARYRAQKG